MKTKYMKFVFGISAIGCAVLLYNHFVGDHLLNTNAVVLNWQMQPDIHRRPLPVRMVNGDFESPDMEGYITYPGSAWAYIPAMNHPDVAAGALDGYVAGWNSIPLYTTPAGYALANHIELQRSFGAAGQSSGQYAEVNVDGRSYLSQSFDTTPGTRLYYSFSHKTRGTAGLHDKMAFFIMDAANSVASSPEQAIRVMDATPDWMSYSGIYFVPQNQTKTQIGFASLNDEAEGNLIDDVKVKTGAYLEVHASSDRSGGFVREGEVLTKRLRIENFGQTNASQITILDRIGFGVEYIGGVKVNGAAVPSSFDAETGTVRIDLSQAIGALDSDQSSMDVSYQVRAALVDETWYSCLNMSQATVSYKDQGYEDLPENAEKLVAYSNVYQIPVLKQQEQTQRGVSLSFEYTNATDWPEHVAVGLFRDDVLLEEVDLNAGNQYSHLFAELGILDENSVLEGMATDSDATLIDDLDVFDYEIRVLGGLENFTIRREMADSKQLILIARYRYLSSQSSSSQSDSKRITTSSAKVANDAQRKSKEDALQKLMVFERLVDDSKLGAAGEVLRYEIEVRNESNEEIQGIWIREYFPEYSNFIGMDAEGSYGIISGKEFGSWFVESLPAGQSKSFYIEVVQDYCLPSDISSHLAYTITDSTQKPWTNDPNGP